MTAHHREGFLVRVGGFARRLKDNPVEAVGKFVANRLEVGRDPMSLREQTVAAPDASHDEVTPTLEDILQDISLGEVKRLSSPHSHGLVIDKHLRTVVGINTLLAALEVAAKKITLSPSLVYLRCVCLAKTGRIDEASDIVSDALIESRKPSVRHALSPATARRLSISLAKTWLVIDAVRRDNFLRQSDGGIGSSGYEDISYLRFSETDFDMAIEPDLFLFMAEPTGRAKGEDRHLKASRKAFDAAEDITTKFGIIAAIISPELGCAADRDAARASALECYGSLRPAWSSLVDFLTNGADAISGWKSPIDTAYFLRKVLRIARELDVTEDIERILEALQKLTLLPDAEAVNWMAAATLMELDSVANREEARSLVAAVERVPKTEAELCEYLGWALRAQAYPDAMKVVEQVSVALVRGDAAHLHAEILQQVGRFREAAACISDGQARLFARSFALCPLKSWSALRLSDELAFAEETADIYSLVPQPAVPKGVVFLTAQSVAELRRSPIMVLIELKRLGWAVIPLVAGLLPLEKTGLQQLDCFLGCLTLQGKLVHSQNTALHAVSEPKVENLGEEVKSEGLQSTEEIFLFEDGEPIEYNAAKEKLVWRDIDLSSALREQVKIDQGRHDINPACPATVQHLSKAVEVVQTHAKILHNLHLSASELDLPVACFVGSNARLPGALYRTYCAEADNSDMFYCVHADSGLQEAFSNTLDVKETRCVMRNVTRYPETSSANFPRRSEFEAYCARHQSSAASILEDANELVTSSASEDGAILPRNLKLLRARIEHWKEEGGKVACVFAQVVCSSDLPVDGGPAHRDMKDWFNHTVEAASVGDTLLLVQPHVRDLRAGMASARRERFVDLFEGAALPENVIVLDHGAFSVGDLAEFVDMGLVYHDAAAVAFGVLGIPCLLATHVAQSDFPIGQMTPVSRDEYAAHLRFEKIVETPPDLKQTSAFWLDYIRSDDFAPKYRYHNRQSGDGGLLPSWWVQGDVRSYLMQGDIGVSRLAKKIIAA